MLNFQGKLKQTFVSLSHYNRYVMLVINAEQIILSQDTQNDRLAFWNSSRYRTVLNIIAKVRTMCPQKQLVTLPVRTASMASLMYQPWRENKG